MGVSCAGASDPTATSSTNAAKENVSDFHPELDVVDPSDPEFEVDYSMDPGAPSPSQRKMHTTQ